MTEPFLSTVRARLVALERQGLRRHARCTVGAAGPVIEIDGARVLNLCSNNYLGLATHPTLIAVQTAATRNLGVGASASRQIVGTLRGHLDAEARLAEFVGQDAAVLFSSGYAANVGAISALVGPGDLVLSDALNHASLIDGCRLSRATVHVYRHADAEHARSLLRAHRNAHANALVVTESLFSMDGDLAPLPALRAACDEARAGLLVDEAHALGVLGPGGRGSAAAAGVRPDALIGTLGKAFGLTGAFVAGCLDLAELVRNRARSYVFSTAPPPALAAAAHAAVDLVEAADDARARVLSHAARLRQELARVGYRVPTGAGAIVPVLVGSIEATMELSQALLDRRVFVHGVRPPTVPEGTARLRLAPMATHAQDQIDLALDAFIALREQLPPGTGR